MSTNPIVLLIILALAVALFVLPKEKLLGPFFLVVVFLPLNQGFQVGGIDMSFARLLIFTIWLRLLLRREFTLLTVYVYLSVCVSLHVCLSVSHSVHG